MNIFNLKRQTDTLKVYLLASISWNLYLNAIYRYENIILFNEHKEMYKKKQVKKMSTNPLHSFFFSFLLMLLLHTISPSICCFGFIIKLELVHCVCCITWKYSFGFGVLSFFLLLLVVFLCIVIMPQILITIQGRLKNNKLFSPLINIVVLFLLMPVLMLLPSWVLLISVI